MSSEVDRALGGTREERRQLRLATYSTVPLERLERMRQSRLNRMARIQEWEMPESIREVEEELIEDVTEAIRLRQSP